MANTIDDFKSKLTGGGARANRFKVNMTFPGGLTVGGATGAGGGGGGSSYYSTNTSLVTSPSYLISDNINLSLIHI